MHSVTYVLKLYLSWNKPEFIQYPISNIQHQISSSLVAAKGRLGIMIKITIRNRNGEGIFAFQT